MSGVRRGGRRAYREESVYRLCEKPKEYIRKKKKYRSKHSPKKAPTASTFRVAKKQTGLMGRETKHTINPQSFRKKNTGTRKLPYPKKFDRKTVKPKKNRVPKKTERPIMGLRTQKNYIRSNIVKNITSEAKKQKEEMNYLMKEDFGQVPTYLHDVKREIDEEYQLSKTLEKRYRQTNRTQAQPLDHDEREDILKKLHNKRNELLKVHQKLTFTIPTTKGKNKVAVTLDHTNHMVRKKEMIEKELDQLEKDIQLLSKENVFVYD